MVSAGRHAAPDDTRESWAYVPTPAVWLATLRLAATHETPTNMSDIELFDTSCIRASLRVFLGQFCLIAWRELHAIDHQVMARPRQREQLHCENGSILHLLPVYCALLPSSPLPLLSDLRSVSAPEFSSLHLLLHWLVCPKALVVRWVRNGPTPWVLFNSFLSSSPACRTF